MYSTIKKLLLTGIISLAVMAGNAQKSKMMNDVKSNKKIETAYFGEGCFWCTEAFFQRIDGVISVRSGYGGGHVDNPTYEEVCEKSTGHAEITKICQNSGFTF